MKHFNQHIFFIISSLNAIILMGRSRGIGSIPYSNRDRGIALIPKSLCAILQRCFHWKWYQFMYVASFI